MSINPVTGTALPLIQAPMAGVQGSAMAAAVSNAGGLGSLPCAMLNLHIMEDEILRLRELTSNPININFFCHKTPEPDAAREALWRKTLAPYYQEWGLDINAIPDGPGRLPFSDDAAEVLDLIRPDVVSFHFGLPRSSLLTRVKARGAQVWSSATTLEEALWLQDHGADAIIAQGSEAGGHRGMFMTQDLSTQVSTRTLLEQLVDTVRIPVIAAGGISNAKAVAQALQMGAAAVQVGTAFMLCPEANTSAIHRAALQSSEAKNTAMTNLFTGRPARGIVNRVMRELGPMSESVPQFPLATSAMAPLRAAAEASGSGDFSPPWAGQDTSGCQAIPAAELTRQLCALVPG